MSKHDALYIEKFQPKRTYLLARGSDSPHDSPIMGVDFEEIFDGVFVPKIDKKKGPESCDSDPLKKHADAKTLF